MCHHCSATLYLRGKATLDTAHDRSVGDSLTPAPSQQRGELAFIRQRTATECAQELKDLKALLDRGVLSNDESTNLKEQGG